jgi:hypothetical protein
LSVALETDSAFAFARSKSRSLAIAQEVNVTFSFGRHKTTLLGSAASVEEALALVRTKLVSLQRADEFDSSFAITERTKLHLLGTSTEFDTAAPVVTESEGWPPIVGSTSSSTVHFHLGSVVLPPGTTTTSTKYFRVESSEGTDYEVH